MKTQQQAEREEQQRIKSLVLNYDLQQDNEAEGDLPHQCILQPNPNIKSRTGTEKHPSSTFGRLDKATASRNQPRTRKLQLSDVDWYGYVS